MAALRQAMAGRACLNRISIFQPMSRSPTWTSGRRYASTATTGTSRVFNFFYGSTLVLGAGIIFLYVTDTRASVHKYVVVPALRMVYPDPETAHEVANKYLKALWAFGLHPRERGDPDKKGDLAVEVFGHVLKNPIGTSAGIDKHADIPDPLFAIGPAIIEIGGTTPLPQPGNEKPRVFRLTSQNAFINRYGLNSEGADHVAARLRHRVREYAYSHGVGNDLQAELDVLDGVAGVPPGSLTRGKLLAINIAKNKSTPETDVEAVAKDYVYCVDRLGLYADILVVNVSSPNTPGLRSLQQSAALEEILTAVVKAAHSTQRKTKPAVMVKVSPDEDSEEQVAGICQAVWASGVDGIIVGNTTNRRPEPLPHLNNLSTLEQQYLLEQGGFSGPHLFERTVSLVKKYKTLLGDKPPSIDVPSRSTGSVDKIEEQTRSEIKASTGVAPRDKSEAVTNQIAASIDTESIPAKNISDKPDSEKQSLFQLPGKRFYDQPQEEQDKMQVSSDPPNSSADRSPQPPADRPKVIFATGGITNGKQALEVLNAGASVAMVYTALVYGGAGTISRIKDEMRDEIQKQAPKRSRSKKS